MRSAFCANLLYVGVIPYIVGRYVLTSWVNWHWIAGLLLNRNRTTNTNIPTARYCFLMLTIDILLSLNALILDILYAACYVLLQLLIHFISEAQFFYTHLMYLIFCLNAAFVHRLSNSNDISDWFDSSLEEGGLWINNSFIYNSYIVLISTIIFENKKSPIGK